MRVIFVHTDFAPYLIEKLEALQTRLGSNGIDFIALEGAGHGGLYEDLPEKSRRLSWWECLHPQGRVQDLAGRQLYADCLAALDRLRPDVVMAWAVAFPTGAAAVRWAVKRKIPVILMDTARRCNVSVNRITNLIKRCFYTNCDTAFIPAPSHSEDYQWWGIPKDRQFYGLNSSMNDVWFKWRKEAIESEKALRTEVALPERFFLGVGRLIPAKNWFRLFEAYKRYAALADNPIDFILIGDGPEHAALVQLSDSLPRGSFHLRSSVTRKELAGYYSLCTAFVLPSINETWGNVVNEAMCCGAPVLISPLCGCFESLVQEGVNGFAMEPFDIGAMADKLGTITDSPIGRLREMGKCSSDIMEQWNIERYLGGALSAIEYCRTHPKRVGPWWSRIVVPFWKGRYRPI